MITSSTVPVVNINQEKTWSLGLEIWQILTVLTIILTLASSLMWFTNLQPENLKQEYLNIDKAKSELYNKAKIIQFNLTEMIVPNQQNVKSLNDCYSDVALLNFDGKQASDQIVFTQQEINQIDVTIKDKISSTFDSGINSISKSALDYSVESKTDVEKIDLYFKNYQEIQKASISLCQSTLAELEPKENQLADLSKKEVMQVLDNGLVSNITNLIKLSRSIYTTVSASGEASKEDKLAFVAAMGNVMSVKFSKEEFLVSSGQKFDNLMSKIGDLESWQTKFLENKNGKFYPTVWVEPKNK